MVKWNGIKTYTLTWTEQIIANGVAPDTDTVIPMAGAERVTWQIDTNGATTGTPDFDFHLHALVAGTVYSTAVWKTLASAVAKDTGIAGILNTTTELGMSKVKAKLDVNTANLAATEFVTLVIKVYY